MNSPFKIFTPARAVLAGAVLSVGALVATTLGTPATPVPAAQAAPVTAASATDTIVVRASSSRIYGPKKGRWTRVKVTSQLLQNKTKHTWAARLKVQCQVKVSKTWISYECRGRTAKVALYNENGAIASKKVSSFSTDATWTTRTSYKPVKVRPVWAKVYISKVLEQYSDHSVCKKCSARTDNI